MPSLESILQNPRVRVRRSGLPNPDGNCIVYWMQRAQRGIDNHALDVAVALGNLLQKPIVVFFGLHPKYPHANLRHYQFLVEGLPAIAHDLHVRNISFVLRPYPQHNLIKFCEEVQPSLVIGDENPMREPEQWRVSASEKLRVPFFTVDADVIVPTQFFPKEEFAARTLRPKIHRVLPLFLQPHENLIANHRWQAPAKLQPTANISAALLDQLPLDRSVAGINSVVGGNVAAMQRLKNFINSILPIYNTARNLPDIEGTSGLSAYLHFGHISPLKIALKVQDSSAPQEAKDAYLEELIVRRELAINFVARNPHYDQLAGCPEWARKTLTAAANDPRPINYTEAQLEQATTHDDLWNAAQTEMVKRGRMHGYLRMYWAKKILEWSATPDEAYDIAVRLNDRYQIDGRDPNGYTGVAWAIGGKHDRPWAPRRPIFGMIRYMSYDGCKRKFDIKSYQQQIAAL